MGNNNIQHQHDDETGSFSVTRGGEEIALLAYNMVSPEVMSIYHTEVDENAEGHGLGTRLVTAAVEFARQNHLKIEPACDFAKSVFEKENGFADVLA